MNKQTTHSASFHCPGRANAEICDAFGCDEVSVSMSMRVRMESHAERMSPPILHKLATFAISFGQSAPRVQFGPGVSSKFQCWQKRKGGEEISMRVVRNHEAALRTIEWTIRTPVLLSASRIAVNAFKCFVWFSSPCQHQSFFT